MTAFVEQENRARTDDYRKDEQLERAVLSVNLALEAHEPEVALSLEPRPAMFVFGLPRSGTTLTHQALTWGLDVGYVSNVMARFWRAPHAGAVISQAVLGEARDDSFISDYGKTIGPAGGHEFAYFWHRWLGIEDVDDLLNFSGSSERARWLGAAAAVARIQAAFDRPLVFKTNYAGQFMPAFARAFPMPMFINVWRDPWPVALSILQARRRYYGDTSVWWSTHPPEYHSLSSLSGVEQIAGQVAGLRRAYAAQMAMVPPELVVDVPYDDLCERPAAMIETVRNRCRAAHGVAPELLHPLPEQFQRSARREPRSDEEHALAQALDRALGHERP